MDVFEILLSVIVNSGGIILSYFLKNVWNCFAIIIDFWLKFSGDKNHLSVQWFYVSDWDYPQELTAFIYR